MKKFDNVLKGLLTAAAVAIAMPVPELAFATDLSGTTSQVTSQIGAIPDLIAGCFWIGGTVMIGAGLLKLKQHSESPGQTPLGQGVGRLAVGAGLLTVPLFGNWVITTLFGSGGNSAGYTKMGVIQ